MTSVKSIAAGRIELCDGTAFRIDERLIGEYGIAVSDRVCFAMVNGKKVVTFFCEMRHKADIRLTADRNGVLEGQVTNGTKVQPHSDPTSPFSGQYNRLFI